MLAFHQVFSAHLTPGVGLATLFTLTLVSVVVIPGAAICDRLLRRQSAAARHQVWLLAIIAVLASPILSAFLPRWIGSGASIAASKSPSEVHDNDRAPISTSVTNQESGVPDQIAEPTNTFVEQREAGARITTGSLVAFESIALIVWICGAAVVLAFGIAGQFSLRQLRLASRVVRDPQLLHLRDRVALQLGLRRDVPLLENDCATMPMTWGVWRPMLLMPAAAREWSEERMRMVLLHELMHVRRRDCLWQCVTLVAVAVHWFNPLIWFAALRQRILRESACDDAGLVGGFVASDYAEQLLDLSTSGRRNVIAMCAGIAMARPQRLKGRLQAIVDDTRNRDPLSRRAKAASAVALALILVPLSVAARANVETDEPARNEAEGTATPSGEQPPLVRQQVKQKPAGDAETADDPEPVSGEVDTSVLVEKLLPDHRLRLDDQGTPVELVSPRSTELKLPASNETIPGPTGYWFNPSIELLSNSRTQVSNSMQAAQLIQLLHALCHGPSFVRQKVYHPREIDGGWLVEVSHDFENYPGMIPIIRPYEILVDSDGRVTRLRQRQHAYLGSADVYSNTITTVYEREVLANRGINYPEVLDEELKRAWAREQGVPLRHNSLVYYPNAVTSVSDEDTGERFYVESNGARLFFLNSNGATVRIVDAVRATDLEHLVGSPVVRHLELRPDEVRATVGKHTLVTIDRKTGEIMSVVSD